MNGPIFQNFPKYKLKLAQILGHFRKIGWFWKKLPDWYMNGSPFFWKIGICMGLLSNFQPARPYQNETWKTPPPPRTKGGVAHWTCQKSIENKGILMEKKGFSPNIRHQPWHNVHDFKATTTCQWKFVTCPSFCWNKSWFCFMSISTITPYLFSSLTIHQWVHHIL